MRAAGDTFRGMHSGDSASSAPLRVRVAAAAETGGPYDALIGAGLLARLPELLRAHVPAHRYALIADDHVSSRYARPVATAASAAGLPSEVFEFPAGEASKTRGTWAKLTDELLDRGFGRDCCIVALGGGVTGDLAGFVAATYLRGVPCVQVPTSLLAMIDASVGGKTAVDVPAGKNLVGAFRQPRLVVMDPETLRSLPDDHFRAGLAEAVKHALLAGEADVAWLEQRAGAIRQHDESALTQLIRRSVEIKAGIVALDTLETGARATLNFGHTIAHALERVTDFAVPHGFAVAIGMVAESRLGESLGVTRPGTAALVRVLLQRCGLPVELPDGVHADVLIAATRTDKKGRASRVRYALLAEPGRAAQSRAGEWTFEASPEALRAALENDAPGMAR